MRNIMQTIQPDYMSDDESLGDFPSATVRTSTARKVANHPGLKDAKENSFKSPTDMLEAERAAHEKSKERPKRRHSFDEAKAGVSAMELVHRRKKNMTGLLEHLLETRQAELHNSIVGLMATDSDSEDFTPFHHESCPAILNYLDSDEEDSVDLAKERRFARRTRPAPRDGPSSPVIPFEMDPEILARAAPKDTSYTMPLPEVVTIDRRREATRRSMQQRSFRVTKRSRPKSKRVAKDKTLPASIAFHQSLQFSNTSMADSSENSSELLTNEFSQVALGQSLTAFLEEHHRFDEDCFSEGSSGMNDA